MSISIEKIRLQLKEIMTDQRGDRPTLSFALVLPLLGIVVSESFLYTGEMNLALWGHFGTLLICTLGPLWLRDDTIVLRAFALVPLFRLVNLGMPVFFQLTVFWFPLIYGPLIPGAYIFIRTQDTIEITIVNDPVKLIRFLPGAVLLSLVLAEIEYVILQPDALIPTWNLLQLLMLGVVMIGFVGVTEEFIFRGILQRILEERLGTWPGLVVASIVFGLMHAGYGLLGEIVFASAIGLLLGYIYDRTDSLILIAVIHGLLNVFLFAVIPIQGSLLSA